jgi:hypothetical protein
LKKLEPGDLVYPRILNDDNTGVIVCVKFDERRDTEIALLYRPGGVRWFRTSNLFPIKFNT